MLQRSVPCNGNVVTCPVNLVPWYHRIVPGTNNANPGHQNLLRVTWLSSTKWIWERDTEKTSYMAQTWSWMSTSDSPNQTIQQAGGKKTSLETECSGRNAMHWQSMAELEKWLPKKLQAVKKNAITLSTKKSTECYFNGLGAKVCCLVPQRTWCPNYKSFWSDLLVESLLCKKANSLGPFENNKNNSFFQWN